MSWREKHHSHDAKNKERIRLVYIRKVKELVRKIFLSTMIMNHQAKKNKTTKYRALSPPPSSSSSLSGKLFFLSFLLSFFFVGERMKKRKRNKPF